MKPQLDLFTPEEINKELKYFRIGYLAEEFSLKDHLSYSETSAYSQDEAIEKYRKEYPKMKIRTIQEIKYFTHGLKK